MNKFINFYVSTESTEMEVQVLDLNTFQHMSALLVEGTREEEINSVEDILALVDSNMEDEVDEEFIERIGKLKEEFKKVLLENGYNDNSQVIVYSWSVEYDWNVGVLICTN